MILVHFTQGNPVEDSSYLLGRNIARWILGLEGRAGKLTFNEKALLIFFIYSSEDHLKINCSLLCTV